MSPLAFALRGIVRQPGRAILGIAGIAATGALLFDMLMLSQGLVISMERLLAGAGFDIRVTATQASPMAGPAIPNVTRTVAVLEKVPGIDDIVPVRLGQALVDIDNHSDQVTFMGANAATHGPWTLLEGREVSADDSANPPGIIVNRNLAARLGLAIGGNLTLRGDCSTNLRHHRFRINERLARQMAAALGELLVLQVNPRGASAL